MSDDPALLFVYGSLMSGQYNSDVLARAVPGAALLRGAAATAAPAYLLSNASFPYLLLHAPPPGLRLVAAPCAIAGEVYALPAGACLRALDAFEGVGAAGAPAGALSYSRVQLRVRARGAARVGGGEELTCWAYAVAEEAAAAHKWAAVARGHLARVASGDWALHTRTAPALPRALACSAPGKVLIAGGYLILQDGLQGLVLAGSARFHAAAQAHALATPPPAATAPSACPAGASQLTADALAAVVASVGLALAPGRAGVVVVSPQFHAAWGYTVGTALPFALQPVRPQHRPASPAEHRPNPYVQAALEAAVAGAVGALGAGAAAARLGSLGSSAVLLLRLAADNDFYSQRWALQQRGLPPAAASLAALPPFLPAPLAPGGGGPVVAKTGLGSSAALVTSLTAATLGWLGALRVEVASSPAAAAAAAAGEEAGGRPQLCPSSRALLHAAAQVAHSIAQGKVGSGFDVASAVYGCLAYARIPAAQLEGAAAGAGAAAAEVAAAGGGSSDGGGSAAAASVEEEAEEEASVAAYIAWCTKIAELRHIEQGSGPRGAALAPFALPRRLGLVLGDVAGGSETPGMVKQVLAWRQKEGGGAGGGAGAEADAGSAAAALPWLGSLQLGAAEGGAEVLGAAERAHQCAVGPPLWRQLAATNAAIAALLGLLEGLSAGATAADYDAALDAALAPPAAPAGGSAPAPSLPAAALSALRAAFACSRACLRGMGERSGVAIEPPAQTRLLDATLGAPGVLAAGVPGAGGCDAVFCIVVEGGGAEAAVERLWGQQTELSVTRLAVRVGPGRGQAGAGLCVTSFEDEEA